MTTNDTLKTLEHAHSSALTIAEMHPAGSKARADALQDADLIAARINDWHERANPTPMF
jgi:hypothetical protein